MVVKLLTN